ncbi:MAG: hypothetical protein R3F39_00705 [Myxococcota bacterium]
MNLQVIWRSGAIGAAVLLATALPASAGIIVTEGDVAQAGGRLLVLSAADGSQSTSGSTDAPVPGGTAGQISHAAGTTGTRGATETTTANAQNSKLPTAHSAPTKGTPTATSPGTDLDGPPADGWKCTMLPGGMQYCEPRGATGAVSGAAGGGTASADDAVTMATIEDGCGGAAGGHSLFGLLAAGFALGFARLRRRATPSYGA